MHSSRTSSCMYGGRAGEQLEQHAAEAVLIASDRSRAGRAAARARCTPACRARSRDSSSAMPSPAIAASPKSTSLTCIGSTRRRRARCDGVTSAWITPRSCTAASACAICRAMLTTSAGLERAARDAIGRGSRPRAAPSRSTGGRRRGGRSRTRRRCSDDARAPRRAPRAGTAAPQWRPSRRRCERSTLSAYGRPSTDVLRRETPCPCRPRRAARSIR